MTLEIFFISTPLWVIAWNLKRICDELEKRHDEAN